MMGMKEKGGEKIRYMKSSSDTKMTIECSGVNEIKRSREMVM